MERSFESMMFDSSPKHSRLLTVDVGNNQMTLCTQLT